MTLNVTGVDPSILHVGNFLCDPQFPIPLANRVQARIVVFNLTMPIIKGSQVVKLYVIHVLNFMLLMLNLILQM